MAHEDSNVDLTAATVEPDILTASNSSDIVADEASRIEAGTAEVEVETPRVEPEAKANSISATEASAETLTIGKLARSCFVELFSFNGIISVLVGIILWLIGQIGGALLAMKGTAFTTSNALDVLLSWQGILLILVAILVAAAYITLDLFAHVYFCESIMRGEACSFYVRATRAVKKAFLSLPRFFTPRGWPTLIYIILLAPLVGVGFSIGLTRGFYIPNFIMDFITARPILLVLYAAFLVAMAIIGILHFFTIHGVLLDGISPSDARRQSKRLICGNAKALPQRVGKAALRIIGVFLVFALLFSVIFTILIIIGPFLSNGFSGNALESLIAGDENAGAAIGTIFYHGLCFAAVISMTVVAGVITLLTGSCIIMYSNHLYEWLRDGGEGTEEPRYSELQGKRRRVPFRLKIGWTILGLILLSGVFGVSYDLIREYYQPVNIVAHRMGGSAMPENSIQGLEFAVSEGCYGAETDIHRTADGHYVINHDDTFKRLSGVNKAPYQMTMEEIEELTLVDPNFPNVKYKVPTLEDAIDAAKGRIILFIELKGKTADRQTVDDVVRIVREKDAVDDVVLISLEYDCIAYAEETYPEFRTGLLFFMQYGDVSLLPADMLLAEEETATTSFIDQVHQTGKEAGVWTVNTKSNLRTFLSSQANYVITDSVRLSKEVQEELDERSDFQFIFDLIWSVNPND